MSEYQPLMSEKGAIATLSYNEIAKRFLTLGVTAFGGPSAHVAMFQQLFCQKLGYFSNDLFAELIALGQCLPGPTSTQTSFAIGIVTKGTLGGLLSGSCFLVFGAIMMTLLGYGSTFLTELKVLGTWENSTAAGLSAVGLGLVAVAAKSLSYKICKTNILIIITMVTAAISTCYSAAWLFPVLIISGGIAHYGAQAAMNRSHSVVESENGVSNEVEKVDKVGPSVPAGILLILGWATILIVSTILVNTWEYSTKNAAFYWFQVFFYTGSLVYGGGPVVLPILMTELCNNHQWITHGEFLTGLGVVQAMPGPMFNISAYLGAVIAHNAGHNFLVGSIACWLGMFVPGVVLIFGVFPFWHKVRKVQAYKYILPGLNAAAVGLICASVFSMYDELHKRSAFPKVSSSIALVGAVLVDGVGLPAPFAVGIGGCLGVLAWSVGAAVQ
eukprot:CFRG7397T1